MPHSHGYGIGNRDSAYSDDSMSVAIGHGYEPDSDSYSHSYGEARAYERERGVYVAGTARSGGLRTPARASKSLVHDAETFDYDATSSIAGQGAVLSAAPTYTSVPHHQACISIVTSPRSSASASANANRANRVSLITSRSLYNIHEPEADSSALGLHLDGNHHAESRDDFSYDQYIAARSTETPSSGVPSLTHSSRASSGGCSTGYSTPVPRRQESFDEAIREKKASRKEKRVGKALLGRLKSFLLAPQSPASAEREIKEASKGRTRLRRTKRAAAPAIEERSSSLYRTVDIPDPLNFAPITRDRRASAFCSGPYGNLAAYNTGVFESTASVGLAGPTAYASVADFRHYSTAELPLDPTVPYSPYAAQETSRWSTFIERSVGAIDSADFALGTDKVKLKEKGASDWASRSKQFWSSALDLTLPRSSRRLSSAMSTVELATQPLPSAAPAAGLVPAPPPVPARSRLRGSPSNGNINGFTTAAATSKQGSPSRTPRTPVNQLPPSPSGSSIGSSSSASAGYATSPGMPVTPSTPMISSPPGAAPVLPPAGGKKYGSLGRAAGGEHQLGSAAWPGQLEQSPTSPANGAAADRRRSRFGRGRHSSSSSVTLSASADPMRIKDGVAPRGSSTGVYTPPTFPGPSPRPSMHSHTPSFASSSTMGTATRSASGSSESSTSGSSAFSIPQTPTSPSAAASRMYTACLGALSGWNLGPGSSTKRASNPAKPISGPIPGSPVHVESGPMSASAAYFPASSSRNSSFSQLHQHQRHQSSRSVSYTTAHTAAPEQYAPVQVWSPENGWTSAAAGLGVGVEDEGAYAQGRTRSSTNASQAQLGPAVIMADAPKGRRKPVPRVEAESQEVHAL